LNGWQSVRMSGVNPFDEIVRNTEAKVQQMKPDWADLERMSRKHPKEMAELLREDGIYWRQVYRRRYRKLRKRYRDLVRRSAESGSLLAEVASLLDRAAVAEVAEKDLLLKEARLSCTRIDLSLAESDEAERAAIEAERDLRYEEFVLCEAHMEAQEAARNGKNPYSAFCKSYITTRRDRDSDFLLAWMPSRFLEPVEKTTTLAQLIGHAGARISLTYHGKLREKWQEERAEPRERLREELPGAVAAAWEAWEQEPRKDRGRFLGYVDEELDNLLGEDDQLWRRLRWSDEEEGAVKKPRLKVRGLRPLPPEEILGVQVKRDSRDRGEGELRRPRVALPEGDEDLMEYERQQTLHQDERRLKGWREGAKFSEREAQVYELDMRMNHDTSAIARELGIDAKTVRGLRKRYTDKLRSEERKEQRRSSAL
jgi:DNA-binding CsgD family transcriptional regulator